MPELPPGRAPRPRAAVRTFAAFAALLAAAGSAPRIADGGDEDGADAAGDAPAAAAASCAGADARTGSGMGDGVAAGSALARATEKAAPRARRIVRLPRLDAAALRAEDDAARAALRGEWKRWDRVGVERAMRPVAVPPFPARWGDRAETLADGSRVFRIHVESPGASGLRVRVRRAALPPGAEVTVHNADRTEEAYGPLAVPKASGDGDPWFAPTVFGDRVVLALRIPAAALDRRIAFVVDGVAQKYRGAGDAAADAADAAHGDTRAAGLGCIRSVACESDLATSVARGVARIEFTSSGNVFLCTATLLNDLDDATNVPWLLTANHCVSTDKVAKTVECYWDYRAQTCNGAAPDLFSVPRTVGATLAATTEPSDCTLLRITGTLPANRYFCGWDAARPAQNDSIVGVHHPQGTPMRVSFGRIEASSADFHTIVWNDGVTAEGSSGSPILDGSQRVVGQLCCGSSFCNRPRDPDEYGRFDVGYAAVLEPFLGVAETPPGPDEWDPGDDSAAGATPLGAPTEAGVTHGRHTLHGADAADWFSVELTAGVPYVFASDDAVRGTLYSDVAATQTVASTAGGPSGFSLVVVPTLTQTHWFVVARAAPGADADYALEVARQDSTPPRAVARLRGVSQARGRVRIVWRDRARDEQGYRVEMLGVGGWVLVGSLPANSTSFDHRPGPGVQAYRVGPYDAIGTNWRKVRIRVRGRPGLDGADPTDDTGAGATVLSSAADSVTPEHELNRNDAADWFRIDLAAGQAVTFEAESDGDTVATVFSDAGGLEPLVDGDDQEGLSGAVVDYDFRIDFTASAAGTYWLQVRAYPALPRATYVLRTTLQSP